MSGPPRVRATTILAVRRAGRVAVIGDGQVTWNETTIIKSSACMVRRLASGQVVCGFAGAGADAITLFELLEEKLEQHSGRLERAAVEVAKQWRTDRSLGRLDALILAADHERTLILSGQGDVLEPGGGAASIGSGSVYALSAARALLDHTDLDAEAIARAALSVAAELCVYTNAEATIEILEGGAR